MEEAVDGYSDKVKVLYTFNIRVELDFGNSTGATDDSIIKEPFTVYISGIGLYLAREIVTLQGGYIRVTSEVGKGSIFSVFLLREQSKYAEE